MITKLETGVGQDMKTEKYGKYFIEFGRKGHPEALCGTPKEVWR